MLLRLRQLQNVLASMLDILLFNALLAGSNLTSRVLLIGDNNQLPSVQAGNVLGDLIDSGKVHVSALTDVMRQKENSNIIKYCTDINEGIIFDPVETYDFHYEEFETGEELKEFFFEKYKEEVEKVTDFRTGISSGKVAFFRCSLLQIFFDFHSYTITFL